jgi:hypothetical protein
MNRETILRVFSTTPTEIDLNLPRWARRKHPIVRRHLGVYWRLMPPQFDSMLNWVVLQSVVVLLTMFAPFLYTILLPLVMVSLALLPVAFFMYARAIAELASDSSRSMVAEIENRTLGLLMTTPLSIRELLLAKISGAMWKQSEAFSMLLMIVSLSQIPVIFLYFANMYPPQQFPAAAQIGSVLIYLTSIARLPIEMFMVGAFGQYMGATTNGRSAAAAGTVTMAAFYFLLINLPRFAPMGPALRIVVEAVIPTALPIALSFALMAMTERALRDGERA